MSDVLFNAFNGLESCQHMMILAEASWLLNAYLFCAIVGGGMVLFSVVFGGHGHADAHTDFTLDAHADAAGDLGGGLHGDAGGGGHGGEMAAQGHGHADTSGGVGHHESSTLQGAFSLASWFSLRFVIFFAAAFGVTGVVLTIFSTHAPNTILLLSLVFGFVFGQGVHRIFRFAQRSEMDGGITVKEFLNQPGRVTVGIQPGRAGEVAVRLGDHERFMTAVARRKDDAFKPGAAVVVTAIQNGRLEVISREEHEFLKR